MVWPGIKMDLAHACTLRKARTVLRLAAGWMALLGAVTEANREAWEAASQIG